MVAMCLGRGRTTKQNWCMFGGRASASTSWVVLENRGQGHCSRYCCMPPWRKTARCTGGHVCPTVAMHKQHRGVAPNQPEIAVSEILKTRHCLISTLNRGSQCEKGWPSLSVRANSGLIDMDKRNIISTIPTLKSCCQRFSNRRQPPANGYAIVDGGQGWLAARMSRPAEACLILQCSIVRCKVHVCRYVHVFPHLPANLAGRCLGVDFSLEQPMSGFEIN
ncbi:Nuclear polyadenylated RNA-binding protein nab2 [Fusarium oxysporum f. sp. albedinis]|nr:Nuclear polyadenylated RNA-binding protein nab2 [Fusarium oxysporum f. sp. albedinis]